ncbi:MAG: class B sortase [Oscillospiraceae bacterium]|nr:class B sortase [Oscillospiraceae bacterium]
MNGSRLEGKKPVFGNKKLLWAALALCICVMAASLIYLGHYFWQIHAQRRVEDTVRDMFVNAKSNPPWAEASPPGLEGEAVPPSDAPSAAPVEEEKEESAWYKEYKRLLAEEEKGRETYAEILAVNPDWLGMVSIPGLIGETPYVQAGDNDKYLSLTFDGRTSDVGTIFLSWVNNRLLLDKNSVLFGHNIKGGAMFANLQKYREAATFQKAPVVVLDGLTGESVWVVFAAYVCEPDWGYIETSMDRDGFSELLEEIRARSLFVTDVDVDEDDRILTLSTCDYTHEDMRFAVHARLLRPDEEIPEAVTAEKNPDQKPYNIPSQKKLSEITASRTAVMQHSGSSKLYFYQPREGGIDWYSGNSYIVQGVYSNYTGRVSKNSFIAAACDPDPDRRRTYLAVDSFNRQKGIVIFTNRLASGKMYYGGLVTPSGVDARYPALTYDDGKIWLLYAVAGDGGEDLYRRLLADGKASGEPELLLAAPPGSGARPLGCYTVDGSLLVFWHEAANGAVYGVWEGGEPFAVPLAGNNDRVTLYGAVTGGKLKAVTEKNGKFSFTSVDIGALPQPLLPVAAEPVDDPAPEPAPAEASEEPEQTEEPAGAPGDEG